jgi:hypothetical protein
LSYDLRVLLLNVFLGLFLAFNCEWTAARQIGALGKPADEDSGIAVSRRFRDRIYHVNDSGDTGRFFITDFKGTNLQIVNIPGFANRDVEALAFGTCKAGVDCIFLGDIGDNSNRRPSIELIAVEEVQTFVAQVTPVYRVRMRYPDGPHNAESMAMHPDGSLYILTKGGVPRLYRLKKNQWMNAGAQVQTLEFVTAIDFEKLGGPFAAIDGRLPTAMDISADGGRLLVLTYRNVFELQFDLSKPLPPFDTWKAGQDFRRVSVEVLDQQEAIAYTPDGRSFIYDTEQPKKGKAAMMRCDCR